MKTGKISVNYNKILKTKKQYNEVIELLVIGNKIILEKFQINDFEFNESTIIYLLKNIRYGKKDFNIYFRLMCYKNKFQVMDFMLNEEFVLEMEAIFICMMIQSGNYLFTSTSSSKNWKASF